MAKTMIAILALMGTLTLMGCETDEDNAVAVAMECLNEVKSDSTADQAKAKECYQEVAGINSSDASYIRCVAILNMRGKTTSSFIDAFISLADTSGTDNSNLVMMSAVSFSESPATDPQTGNSATVDAEELLRECSNSGSSGLTMVASMAQMGTYIASLNGGSNTGDLADIQAGLALVDDPAEEAAVGSAARAAYDSYCSGSTSDNEFCAAAGDTDISSLTDQELGALLVTEFSTDN